MTFWTIDRWSSHLTHFMQLPFTRFLADYTSSIPIFHQFVVYNCVIPILYWFECSFQTLFFKLVLSAASTFAVFGFTCNGGQLWRTCLGRKLTVRKTGYALEWAEVQTITHPLFFLFFQVLNLGWFFNSMKNLWFQWKMNWNCLTFWFRFTSLNHVQIRRVQFQLYFFSP